jgi:hypothetical protein
MKFANDHDLDLKPYENEDLEITEDMKGKIEKLMKFFDDHGIDYDKFDKDKTPKLDFGKIEAYPNNDQYMHIPGQHNTQKWLQAISEIYRKEQSGENRVSAIRRVTSGWNIMETFDFLNWIKFHESGDHMKYKFAQLWYENDALGPGYFLQVKKDPTPPAQPTTTGQDIDFARDRAAADSDKRQTIEKQRNKIIGRLDSAEKLLRSPDGHVFSGKEFESLLESIYQLKKKIQMVNKISSSTRLYEDMIIREANILNVGGFTKAANILYSLAQTPAASGEQAKGTPNGKEAIQPPSPPDPSGAGNPGAPGGLPSVGPGMPQGAPSSAAPESVGNENSPGIQQFLAGLNEGRYSPTDKQTVEDNLDVEDTIEVLDSDDSIFVTEAQMATPGPINEPLTTSPAPAALDPSPVAAPENPKNKAKESVPATEEPLEVTEDDIAAPIKDAEPSASDFDAKVDAVFSDITVNDVVAKLEDLAKIFKTREVPRQLGIVDMMLDSLGLASYFPSLSEATNKALESNNYISTRVEDIISKLRGAMTTHEIDLKGGNNNEKPEVAGIKGKLKEDEDKEKSRKQMRKEQEAAELSNKGKETPEVEIEEDLGASQPKVPTPAPRPLA